jgi:hypothetical protein
MSGVPQLGWDSGCRKSCHPKGVFHTCGGSEGRNVIPGRDRRQAYLAWRDRRQGCYTWGRTGSRAVIPGEGQEAGLLYLGMNRRQGC